MTPFAEAEVDCVAGFICCVRAADVDGAGVADPAVVGWCWDKGYVGKVPGWEGGGLVVKEGLGLLDVFWSGVETDGFEGCDCRCEGYYLVACCGVQLG